MIAFYSNVRIINRKLTIWDSNTLQKQIIDTGLRDPLSLIVWSKTAAVLAVGTARGNLAIYNHQTTKYVNMNL